MASSSSSHQRNQGLNAFSEIEPPGKRRRVSESSTLYDVFINHRGPDVKGTLATQLYKSFEQLGIKAFLDSEEKELGNSFPSTIEMAILSAKVHIAIFSPRYAESPWCLDELVLMLESTAKIIPLFYQVKPSDLRHIEKGIYSGSFIKHKQKGRYLEKISGWMEALQSLSLIAGEEFNSEGDCQKIVAAAHKEVQRNTVLHVAEYPVGLNNIVEDFQKRCLDKLVQDFENQFAQEEGKSKAQVVAIFGMGGVGKTTLAKELFNRKKSNYSTASFLFDVREAHVRGQLPSLQCKLLKDLFNEEHIFTSTEEGKSCLKDRLRRASHLRALIVVDDIDHVEQLNALAVMNISNKYDNNLVIVTTRDAAMLIHAGISDGYNLKGMTNNSATELFCWHAFSQNHPCIGYEVLVKDFVHVCGGLPLSLQVMGRHVRGKAQSYWSSELIKVRKMLPRDIKQRLRISFDALDDEEKQVFMDVACFFLGQPKRIAERVWEESGWDAKQTLETLKDRCLVEEFSVVLKMHDHLRDLGRELALELSSPRRLWRPQDLKSLESMGLKAILEKINARCFHSIFDESMGSQVTFFLGHSDICVETSASVLWLLLKGNSTDVPSIPSWIPQRKLHFLKILRGRLKTLWENPIQAPYHLKELIIVECSELEELTSLSRASCMENIEVRHCQKLLTIAVPTTLLSLSLHYCKNLRTVSGAGDFMELKKTTVRGCPELEELPSLSKVRCMDNIEVETCEKLWTLTLPTTLFSLSLQYCRNLNVSGTGNFLELKKLIIRGCPQLEELPNLSKVSCMENIEVDTCEKLLYITLPTTLFTLSVQNCRNFQGVSGTGDLMELKKLTFRGCPQLEELPCLSKVSCMENIEIETCEKLLNIKLPTTVFSLYLQNCRNFQGVSGMGDLMELKKLMVRNCPRLEEMSWLSGVSCMENIEVDTMESLHSVILPTTLLTLSLQNCRNLRRISGTVDCMELKMLTVRQCPQLEELPFLSRVSYMENIEVDTCDKLQSITLPISVSTLSIQNCNFFERISGINDLIELKKLRVRNCPELEELPWLSGVSCMENIEIDNWDKIQSITLPTTLFTLSLQNCRNLRRVSGADGLMELRILTVRSCPELEELSWLSGVSCMENIEIDNWDKLQSITLPTALFTLSLQNCKYLQKVAAAGDLTELRKLTIRKCPELEELPSIFRLSILEHIMIESCEKLKKLLGVEELQALELMTLECCGNELICNCIHKLKNLPSWGMVMTGKAVDGAESILNESLFSKAHIGVDSLTDITQHAGYDYDDNYYYYCYEKLQALCAVITCYMVVVDCSASAEALRVWLHPHYDLGPRVGEGGWIITSVGHFMNRDDGLRRFGIIKKGFRVEVKEGEESKGLDVLRSIVDKLHHL